MAAAPTPPSRASSARGRRAGGRRRRRRGGVPPVGGRGRTRQQRSHGPAISPGLHRLRWSHAGLARVLGAPVPWVAAMPDPDAFDAFYQERARPPAAADLRPHRRPDRGAHGRPGRLRLRLAPLAQGLAARGPRVVGPPAGLGARAAPPPARLWHRDKGVDPAVTRTLDALGRLPAQPAPAAAAQPPDHAVPRRGGPRGRADPGRGRARAADRGDPLRPAPRRAEHGAARRCSSRCASTRRRCAGPGRRSCDAPAPPAGVRTPRSARSPRWPRSVVTGWLVTDAAGVAADAGPRVAHGPRGCSGGPDATRVPRRRAAPPTLPASAMLSPARRSPRLVDGPRWSDDRHRPTTPGGSGLVAPCQQARYADPQGTAALVRTFATGPRRPAGPGPAASAVQTAEVSRSTGGARGAASTSPPAGTPGAPTAASSCSPPSGSAGPATRRCCWCCAPGTRPVTTLVVGVARTGAHHHHAP